MAKAETTSQPDYKNLGMMMGAAVAIIREKYPKEFEEKMLQAKAFEDGQRSKK